MEFFQIVPVELATPTNAVVIQGFAVFSKEECSFYKGSDALHLLTFPIWKAVVKRESHSLQLALDGAVIFISSDFIVEMDDLLNGRKRGARYGLMAQHRKCMMEIGYETLYLYQDDLLVGQIPISRYAASVRGKHLAMRLNGQYEDLQFQTERACNQVAYAMRLVQRLRFTRELAANTAYYFDDGHNDALSNLATSGNLASSCTSAYTANQPGAMTFSLLQRMSEVRGTARAVDVYAQNALPHNKAELSLAAFEASQLQSSTQRIPMSPASETVTFAIYHLNAILPARAVQSGKRYYLVFSYRHSRVYFSVFHLGKPKYENETLDSIVVVRQLGKSKLVVQFLPMDVDMEVDAALFRSFHNAFCVLQDALRDGACIEERQVIPLLQ